MPKALGFQKGRSLTLLSASFNLKDDSLGDPILCREHIRYMNAVNEEELAQIEKAALEINSVLSEHMDSYGITLVDFKLEFGKTSEGEIILADEISLTPAVSD